MGEIVRKIESSEIEPLRGLKIEGVIRVEAHTAGRTQKKYAEVWSDVGDRQSSRWGIECDEVRATGGEDAAPSPLPYFAAGAAF